MNYNYVIFATDYDLYKYTFQDAVQQCNAQFYCDVKDLMNPIEKILYRVCFNERLNQKINVPFKKLWNRIIFNKIHFTEDKPICIIWFWHFQNIIENGFVEYSRQMSPDVRHVFFFSDIKNLSKTDLSVMKNRMDIVSVFDRDAAEENNLKYMPHVYSSSIAAESGNEEIYDLCFVGYNKGRKEKLEKIAQICIKNGLKIAFYIIFSPNEAIDNTIDGIHYQKKPLTYPETVEIMKRSRCLLELKASKYDACTLRVQEAVVLGKRILTDNEKVKRMPCCDECDAVSVFDEIDAIDIEFLKKQSKADYEYHEEYSPITFLENIEKELEVKEKRREIR